jgi:hypothetical protein
VLYRNCSFNINCFNLPLLIPSTYLTSRAAYKIPSFSYLVITIIENESLSQTMVIQPSYLQYFRTILVAIFDIIASINFVALAHINELLNSIIFIINDLVSNIEAFQAIDCKNNRISFDLI